MYPVRVVQMETWDGARGRWALLERNGFGDWGGQATCSPPVGMSVRAPWAPSFPPGCFPAGKVDQLLVEEFSITEGLGNRVGSRIVSLLSTCGAFRRHVHQQGHPTALPVNGVGGLGWATAPWFSEGLEEMWGAGQHRSGIKPRRDALKVPGMCPCRCDARSRLQSILFFFPPSGKISQRGG